MLNRTGSDTELQLLLECATAGRQKQAFVAAINHLLVTDFSRLVQWLYRIDVDEKKLRQLLASNAQRDAAEVIADALIERQLQKQKARQQFKPGSAESSEERW